MSNLFNRIEAIWDDLREGKTKTRAHFRIDRQHVDKGQQLGPRFKKGQHYLQVIINEMFLANERQWYKSYDPMAIVVTSFVYDKGQSESLPLVVGPNMLKDYRHEVPTGMIFQNTPVTGLHPYRGGSLGLTIILSRLARENNADKLLQIVESISSTIDLSAAFFNSLKITRTVMSSIEILLSLQQTIPIAGYRTIINPDIGDPLEPTYFVLINADAQQIDPHKFWVHNSQLYSGNDLTTAQPYYEQDFILFSIGQANTRTDIDTLSFFPLWEKTRDLAQQPDPHYWQEAKAQYNTLKRQIRYSPDLIKADAERLVLDYLVELKRLRDEAELESVLAPTQLPEEEIELQRIAAELAGL
jgi:hypothetical protein